MSPKLACPARARTQVSFKSEVASTLRDKLAAQERQRTSAEEVRVLRGEAASLTGQLDAFVKAKVDSLVAFGALQQRVDDAEGGWVGISWRGGL